MHVIILSVTPKMVKHTQNIRRQHPTNCLSVFDHFVRLAIKGLSFALHFKDPRFNQEVDKKTGYNTKSILCMPVKSHPDEVKSILVSIPL